MRRLFDDNYNDDSNNGPKLHKIYPTRFARFLERYLGGQFVTIDTVENNVIPVVEVGNSNKAENLILTGEQKVTAYQYNMASDVVSRGVLWLWNNVPKLLCVIEHFWLQPTTGGDCAIFQTTQDLPGNFGNYDKSVLDTRLLDTSNVKIDKGMASVRGGNNGATPTGLNDQLVLQLALTANERFDFASLLGEIVLTQGYGLAIAGPINSILSGGFVWRERIVETNQEYSGL
jgi:hypothetical protein